MNKLWNNYFIFLLILVLILIKVSWLNLPFYWDEAWSYAMAIFDMANNGPSIIPGNTDDCFTRGHPLFFYFIASSWLVLFGKTVLSAHLFALLVSCSSLFIIHFCCRKFVSIKVANIVALSLMAQIMFIAQSTLLLPEVFLMGLSFLVFYLYLQKKWWYFIGVSFCLILSKETALVLFAVLFFDKIILQKLIYRSEYKYNIVFFKEIFFVVTPFLFFGIFLLIQKRNLGYFFFPSHIELMNLTFAEFVKKTAYISEWVFLRHSRWIWLCVAAVAIMFGIRKKIFSVKEIHLFILLGVFIWGYILFSGLNFFIPRYILTLLPFSFLLFTLFIIKCFPKYIGILLLLVAILGNIFRGIWLSDGEMDTSRTFNQTILAHKEAVNFCESQQWHDKTINTGFLMHYYLEFPQLGYLNNKEKSFSKFNNEAFPDVFIFYSIEQNSKIDEIRNNTNYELVKQITKPNGCWVEIFEKKLPED